MPAPCPAQAAPHHDASRRVSQHRGRGGGAVGDGQGAQGCGHARQDTGRLSPLLSHTHSPRALVLCCACKRGARRQLARSRQGQSQLLSSAAARAKITRWYLGPPPQTLAARRTARGGGARGSFAPCRHAPHDVARPVGVALDNHPGAALGGVRAPIFCPPLQRLRGELHRHAHARLAVPAHQLLLRTDTTPQARGRGARAAGPSARVPRTSNARPRACTAPLARIGARTAVDTVTDILSPPALLLPDSHSSSAVAHEFAATN